SSTGHFVAGVTTQMRTIKFWWKYTMRSMGTLDGLDSVAFSPKEEALYAIGLQGRIALREAEKQYRPPVEGGEPAGRKVFLEGKSSARSLAFSPSGSFVYAGGDEVVGHDQVIQYGVLGGTPKDPLHPAPFLELPELRPGRVTQLSVVDRPDARVTGLV